MTAALSFMPYRLSRLLWCVGLGAAASLFAGIVSGMYLVPAFFGVYDLKPLQGSSTAGPIAVNNVTVGLVMLVLGIVTVSVSSLVVMFINGGHSWLLWRLAGACKRVSVAVLSVWTLYTVVMGILGGFRG